MGITTIPAGHFDGGAGISNKAGGVDPRDLRTVLNEVIAAANYGASVTEKQATAADASGVLAFIAPAAGEISSVYARAGATAASGESMAVDVKINGTSCLSAAISLAAADTTVAKAGTLDSTKVTLAAGDVVTIDFDYTAGGGPTPIVNTMVTIGYNVAG